MPLSGRFWKTYTLLALLSLLLLAVPNLIWWLSASPSERAWLLARYPFLLVLIVLVLGGVYALWHHIYQTYVRPIEQLTDALHQVLAGHPLPLLLRTSTQPLRKLQKAVIDLVRRQRLHEQTPSTGHLHHERNLLATLLGVLPEAVLVCRPSGQILLYNEAARQLLEPPEHPGTIGLGRSVFHALDRDLIIFALDELAHCLHHPPTPPVIHFATALPSGTFVRVHASLIRDETHPLEAFVLILRKLEPEPSFTERMRGLDLLQALRVRLRQALDVTLEFDGITGKLWVQVRLPDAFEGLYRLVHQLHLTSSCRRLQARTLAEGNQVHLWLRPLDGKPIASSDLASYLQDRSIQTLLQTHQATLHVEADALHLTLPAWLPLHQGAARGLLPEPSVSHRPVYVDLSLPGVSEATPLDDRPLHSLIYTVFDTETTGLHPEQGDEIIAIGAVRIVGGRIRHEETFEQLINPRRPLSLDSVRVHGIQPILLQDKPTIEEVLPRFYHFARDTVLVGHHVAFDLRFIRLKEKALGLRFDQPVLDTMLLAALVDPERQHYGLDELAAAFGIELVGRHSALGDALITAELFLRLLPLLEQRGIYTLRQARQASQQTRLARNRYGRIS